MQFSEITATKIPFVYLEFDSSLAGAGLAPKQPYRVLLIGEKGKDSDAVADLPVQVSRASEVEAKFGEESMLYKMAKIYFQNCNLETWIVTPSNPKNLKSVFTHVSDTQFNMVACGYSDPDSLKTLKDEMQDRAHATRQIEGLAFGAYNDAENQKKSNDLNSPYVCLMKCCDSKSDPSEWAAALVGVSATSAQIDPAMPFHGLELKDIHAPEITSLMNRSERELALKEGFSTFTVDSSKTVRIERLITTYNKKQPGNIEDMSYFSANIPLVLSFLRWDFRRYFSLKYGRSKLAGDNYKGPGPVLTPKLAKAEALCLFRSWEQDLGLVQDAALFQSGLHAEIDPGDPSRLNISLSPKLVSQLSVIGAKLSFLL